MALGQPLDTSSGDMRRRKANGKRLVASPQGIVGWIKNGMNTTAATSSGSTVFDRWWIQRSAL